MAEDKEKEKDVRRREERRMTIPSNLLGEVKDFKQLTERLDAISREYNVPNDLCRQIWLFNLTRNIGVMSGHSLDRVISRSTDDTVHYVGSNVAGWTTGINGREEKRRAG